ncbi:MAG: glycerol-3-phosphate dehydrogenase/oxidase [Gemmatimonadales bacterium]
MQDLLILGGGIVGAGVARDAAMRGLSVTLIDKHTVGWGTSSRSSRLIHGGIRYLELGDIGLVREALRERGTLLRIAPDLVHETPFLFVLDRGAWWQWARIGVGVLLYRLLAGRHALGPHHPLTRAGLLRREPLLAAAPLLGGAIYQDARGDDLGLVRANIAAAREHGARILEETLARIELGDTGTVRATLPSGEAILARTLVLALGPWTDEVRAEMGLPARDLVGGTKGVHIEFASDRLPLRHALALRHPDDRRVMFCVPEPERSRVLVGTTDTETDESPDALTVGAEDVAYLLRAVQHLFPALGLGDEDIVDRWVGVRPLLQQEGSASSRSREHGMIREGAVLTIAGGKLTTYRDMAEEAVDLIGEALGRDLPPCRTAVVPLPVGSSTR